MMLEATPPFEISVHNSIADIGREIWESCLNASSSPYNPTISYDFLYGLEKTKCAHANTGWFPQHLMLKDKIGEIFGILPLYLKNHSHGEYVFDWSWADAYERAGGQYYPKLLSAIPFTPVNGPRFILKKTAHPEKLLQALASGLIQLAEKFKIATVHINFLSQADINILKPLGFLERNDVQFHWKNDHYSDFDDFLETLTSRKRRSIKKERKKLHTAGITMQSLTGDQITQESWDYFYRFYIDTYDRKWGSSYLTRDFFAYLHDNLRDKICLILAFDIENQPIAGALNLIGEDRLIGRNWGCLEDYKFLHFETCYYQAIEFAIAHKLSVVEAGTQGYHKLQRGYLPVKTYSAHYIADEGFKHAIEQFLNHERRQIEATIDQLSQQTPFKTEE